MHTVNIDASSNATLVKYISINLMVAIDSDNPREQAYYSTYANTLQEALNERMDARFAYEVCN